MKSVHHQCAVRTSDFASALPLHLLQVCRQIYGEAVLTPFVENAFITSAEFQEDGLRAFLPTLIPVQVRAIAHLTLVAHADRSNNHIGTLKLQGLKSLHLILPHHLWSSGVFRPFSESLQLARFNTLSRLKLKSVRITYTLTGSKKSNALTDSVIGEIEESVKRQENEILNDPDLCLARLKAEDEKYGRLRKGYMY